MQFIPKYNADIHGKIIQVSVYLILQKGIHYHLLRHQPWIQQMWNRPLCKY